MKKRFKLIAVVVFFMSGELFSQFVFIGPMFHYYMGNGKNDHFAWGFEVSYWRSMTDNNENFKLYVPNSIDLGIEFAQGKTRLYSEAQFGALIGLSLGYVREFESWKQSKGGFQGSLWASVLLGVDMRFQFLEDPYYLAPGLFFKLPVVAERIPM